MVSLMNKCYRIYIACIIFINMRYTFGMLLLKHPVLLANCKILINYCILIPVKWTDFDVIKEINFALLRHKCT